MWGRSEFEGIFEKAPAEANAFLDDPARFLGEARSLRDNASKEKLEKAVEILVTERVETFEDCLAWARNKFSLYFHNRIMDLITSFPEDSMTREGAPFWSPPKRFPRPLDFSKTDPLVQQFVQAASRLKAEMHGIDRPVWANDIHALMEARTSEAHCYFLRARHPCALCAPLSIAARRYYPRGAFPAQEGGRKHGPQGQHRPAPWTPGGLCCV